MPLYKGSSKIKSLNLGGISIAKLYKGNVLVYDSNPPKRRVINVENYNYTTNKTDDVVLTKYKGTVGIVIVPQIEEI